MLHVTTPRHVATVPGPVFFFFGGGAVYRSKKPFGFRHSLLPPSWNVTTTSLPKHFYFCFTTTRKGQDGLFGIVTSYVLDVLGFESRWGKGICSSPQMSELSLSTRQPSLNGYRRSFQEVKRPVQGVNQSLLVSSRLRISKTYTLVPVYGCMAC
jgi:hypothetical protein